MRKLVQYGRQKDIHMFGPWRACLPVPACACLCLPVPACACLCLQSCSRASICRLHLPEQEA
jgi:hypothetical protein